MKYLIFLAVMFSACATPKPDEAYIGLIRMTVLEEFEKRDTAQWNREQAIEDKKQEERDFNVRCDSRELSKKIRAAEARARKVE